VTSARRRARRIEWLLLATLLPLYLATQVGLVKAYRASDGRVVPLRVSPAQGADGASRLQSMTRELCASIALDETTRERAGHVCADFVRHASCAIRGRTERMDVFALPRQPTRNGPA
jgi:hypothetical protein